MNNWNTWSISYEDRNKHDESFQFLRPVNGFITGEQARSFFTQSNLANAVLAKIWALADLTGDGKLDKKEFSIAMFMIKKCLQGNTLPSTVPATLLQDPQPFIPKPLSSGGDNLLNSMATAPTLESNGASTESNNWTIPVASRPRYRLQFNQNDRNKRGYLTGVEARGIFLKSNLPQATLANVWNLADVDKDGNLTCDEFCIAAYLIDQALAGRKLPISLPPTLLPSSHSDHSNNSLNLSHSASAGSDMDQKNDRQTFEDKRMQNFLRGQAELDKRKQEMTEQIRQEEENRREQARLEAEKQENLRLEKEKERQKHLEMEAERQRQLEVQQEARRQQAAAARFQTLREEQRARALEAERMRSEALAKERAREMAALEQARVYRASLLEAARSQSSRVQSVASRCSTAQAEVSTHKAAIVEMGARRDQVERENRDLTERVEAAKAELHRWQCEHQQLSLQVATEVNHASEQYKTLQGNLKQLNDSKYQLEQQLAELDAGVTQRGQTLASHWHQAEELAKKQAHLSMETRTLRTTLLERYKVLREKKRASAAAAAPNYDSNTFSGGKTESYTAMYSYTAAQPDELTFVKNDRIQVFIDSPVPLCEGWLFGETSSGKRGLVPAGYLKKDTKIDPFAILNSNPFPNAFASSFPSTLNPLLPNAGFANSLPLEDAKSIPSDVFSDHPILFTCIALYDFEAKLAGDLSLKRDEKVGIISENNGWYDGISMSTKQRGMFPANYVQKLQPDPEPVAIPTTNPVAAPPIVITTQPTTVEAASPEPSVSISSDQKHIEPTATKVHVLEEEEKPVITLSETSELALATTPFTAQSGEQLSLVPGQYVKILKRSSKGWWEGEMQQRGQGRQIGWFPADYVRLVNSTTPISTSNDSIQPEAAPVDSNGLFSTSNTTVTASGGIMRDSSPATRKSSSTTNDLASCSVVHAKFAYKACQADELTFEEGALIHVLAQEEVGWWRGRIQGTNVEGLFPVNYVKPALFSAGAATEATTTSSKAPVVNSPKL